jgi:signal transduction histidine kinase
MVRFLLDSSREAGGERADVPATLRLALRLLERHPSLARLRVRTRLPKSLPPVLIDAGSLKQVVMALVVNASAATPAGGTLELAVGRHGSRLHVDVIDSAQPLDADERALVFEPYADGDAQRAAGLGLAVARGLLRSRGGDLVYRPRKDGNVFRVVLRVATGKR